MSSATQPQHGPPERHEGEDDLSHTAYSPSKSKTIWAGIFGALFTVLPVVTQGTFGPKAQAVGYAATFLLGAFGVRDAISKNGTGA